MIVRKDNSPPVARRVAGWAARAGTRGALLALAVYRLVLSPLLVALGGHACRFTPSCSQYAQQALARHGLRRGCALAVGRLLRCRPGGGWGYDPVSLEPLSPQRPSG